MLTTADRYHDFSAGHRVAGHESKCAHLHGHNYRAHFTIAALDDKRNLDVLGRVIDFSVINRTLCAWLEENWDHRFLAWEQDPVMNAIDAALNIFPRSAVEENNKKIADSRMTFEHSIVWTPFNPTAENMALSLLRVVGPTLLAPLGVRLIRVRLDETRKCSAEVSL